MRLKNGGNSTGSFVISQTPSNIRDIVQKTLPTSADPHAQASQSSSSNLMMTKSLSHQVLAQNLMKKNELAMYPASLEVAGNTQNTV